MDEVLFNLFASDAEKYVVESFSSGFDDLDRFIIESQKVESKVILTRITREFLMNLTKLHEVPVTCLKSLKLVLFILGEDESLAERAVGFLIESCGYPFCLLRLCLDEKYACSATMCCARVINRVRETPSLLVQIVISNMLSRDRDLRYASVLCLSRMHEKHPEANKMLLTLLLDSDPVIFELAARILKKNDTEDIMNALKRNINSCDKNIQLGVSDLLIILSRHINLNESMDLLELSMTWAESIYKQNTEVLKDSVIVLLSSLATYPSCLYHMLLRGRFEIILNVVQHTWSLENDLLIQLATISINISDAMADEINLEKIVCKILMPGIYNSFSKTDTLKKKGLMCLNILLQKQQWAFIVSREATLIKATIGMNSNKDFDDLRYSICSSLVMNQMPLTDGLVNFLSGYDCELTQMMLQLLHMKDLNIREMISKATSYLNSKEMGTKALSLIALLLQHTDWTTLDQHSMWGWDADFIASLALTMENLLAVSPSSQPDHLVAKMQRNWAQIREILRILLNLTKTAGPDRDLKLHFKFNNTNENVRFQADHSCVVPLVRGQLQVSCQKNRDDKWGVQFQNERQGILLNAISSSNCLTLPETGWTIRFWTKKLLERQHLDIMTLVCAENNDQPVALVCTAWGLELGIFKNRKWFGSGVALDHLEPGWHHIVYSCDGKTTTTVIIDRSIAGHIHCAPKNTKIKLIGNSLTFDSVFSDAFLIADLRFYSKQLSIFDTPAKSVFNRRPWEVGNTYNVPHDYSRDMVGEAFKNHLVSLIDCGMVEIEYLASQVVANLLARPTNAAFFLARLNKIIAYAHSKNNNSNTFNSILRNKTKIIHKYSLAYM